MLAIVILILLAAPAYAQTSAEPCPRPHVGSVVAQPAELVSANGLLAVEFSFQTFTDPYGRRRYCYIAGDGSESPTLRVHPGDELVLKLIVPDESWLRCCPLKRMSRISNLSKNPRPANFGAHELQERLGGSSSCSRIQAILQAPVCDLPLTSAGLF